MNYIINTFNRFEAYFKTPAYIANEDISSSSVIICLEAKSDRLGSLRSIGFFDKVTQLEKTNIKIVRKIVRNIEEANDFTKKIKDQSNVILGLVIRAHGNPRLLKLSSRTKCSKSNHSTIDASNTSLLQPTFSRLENKATIILESCSVGKEKEGFAIANHIAQIAKRTVIAPNYYLPSLGTKYTLKDSGISVDFKGKFYPTDSSWLSLLKKITYHFLFVFGLVQLEIKQEFHPE